MEWNVTHSRDTVTKRLRGPTIFPGCTKNTLRMKVDEASQHAQRIVRREFHRLEIPSLSTQESGIFKLLNVLQPYLFFGQKVRTEVVQ